MASILTWVSWFWPSILILILLGLSTVLPGGVESLVLLGLVGLQVVVVGIKGILWVVAEIQARSAQTN